MYCKNSYSSVKEKRSLQASNFGCQVHDHYSRKNNTYSTVDDKLISK